MRQLMIVMASSLLASCGVAYQQTPEPNETERVDEIVAALGTEQTYNSETLLWNAKPDGLILRDWMERRKATLDGTLRPDKLPALSNPGSISDTLEWERATSRREGNSHRPWNAYRVSLEADVWRCPTTGAAEAAWYERYSAEHARGQHNSLVDWEATLSKFREKCKAELTELSEQHEAQQQREDAAEADLSAARQECRRQWENAREEYHQDPSFELGKEMDAAGTDMRHCLDALEGI